MVRPDAKPRTGAWQAGAGQSAWAREAKDRDRHRLPALEYRSSTATDPGAMNAMHEDHHAWAARTATDVAEAQERQRPANGPK